MIPQGPPLQDSPYALIGGEDGVRALVKAFYDAMQVHQPGLAAVHKQDEGGQINAQVRYRFGLFLMGWLGGPQDYMAKFGHPRLRMRHAKVAVDTTMAAAWTDSMRRGMDELDIKGPVRRFLDLRFKETADFLINVDSP